MPSPVPARMRFVQKWDASARGIGCVCRFGLFSISLGVSLGAWIFAISVENGKGVLLVQLDIATRHGQLGDVTQAKIKTKAEKLHRYFDRLTSIEIIVDLEDPHSTTEHKHDFVAHDKSESLMAAVESALQKIEQQLHKYKQRIQQRHRNPDARRQEVEVSEESDESLESDSV